MTQIKEMMIPSLLPVLVPGAHVRVIHIDLQVSVSGVPGNDGHLLIIFQHISPTHP